MTVKTNLDTPFGVLELHIGANSAVVSTPIEASWLRGDPTNAAVINRVAYSLRADLRLTTVNGEPWWRLENLSLSRVSSPKFNDYTRAAYNQAIDVLTECVNEYMASVDGKIDHDQAKQLDIEQRIEQKKRQIEEAETTLRSLRVELLRLENER